MEACVGTGGGAVVLPFVPRPPRPLRLTVSDRIVAMRWLEAARPHGVRELRIHEPEYADDPAVGAFVLIYEHNEVWAAWGVGVRRGSFEVWRPGSSATLGWYRTLGEALRAIKDVG